MSDKGPVAAGTGSGVDPRLGGLVGAGVLAAMPGLVPALAPLAVLSPFPLAVARLRGLGSAIAAALFAAAIVAMGRPEEGISFLFVVALPGLLLGGSVARGRGLVRGCGWAFAVLALEIAVTLLLAGHEVELQALSWFDASSRLVASNGASPGDLARVRVLVTALLPGLCLIGAGAVVLANAALLRLYLLRRDPASLEEGEFERIRFPFALVVAFVLAGGAVAARFAQPVAYNTLLIVAFFFALQGFAVVAFYGRRLAAPPFLRIALVLLVLLNPWAPQILALLGLFDNWFDFRRFAEPPSVAGPGQ